LLQVGKGMVLATGGADDVVVIIITTIIG